jgi:hypothetical protein
VLVLVLAELQYFYFAQVVPLLVVLPLVVCLHWQVEQALVSD